MGIQAASLRRIPLFVGLDGEELEAAAKAFHEDTFPAGKTIVHDSDKSASFYLLMQGSVEVRRGGKAIATLTPYEFFGDILALGFQYERTADVVALGPCTCLVAGQKELQELLSNSMAVGRRVLKVMHDRYKNDRLTV